MLRIGICLAVVVLSACASTPVPDLQRLYALTAGDENQPPVILVHGALGSRLTDFSTGEEVWIGSVSDLLFRNYEELALEIDPNTLEPLPSPLEPSGITDRIAGIDYYASIVRTLEDIGGYEFGEPGKPAASGEKRYYVFVYDWRQDNLDSVRELDALINQVRADYDQPDLKVDIIAHSMGGIITRYFARYGPQDVQEMNEFPRSNYGVSRIRRAILLGTPNFGAAGVFLTISGGYRLGFGTIPTEVVTTFPSTYQVLPHAISNFLLDVDGMPVDDDIFDVNFWRRTRLSIFHPEVRARVEEKYPESGAADARMKLLERHFEKRLERARRFTWSLAAPLPPEHVEYIMFGGDCVLTQAHAILETVNGQPYIRHSAKEIENPNPDIDYEVLLSEPGDGTVTKASLLARQTIDPTISRHKHSIFPLRYAFFLCEGHERLTGNIQFRNNLLNALLTVDNP